MTRDLSTAFRHLTTCTPLKMTIDWKSIRKVTLSMTVNFGDQLHCYR
jgi:hypothetical protein